MLGLLEVANGERPQMHEGGVYDRAPHCLVMGRAVTGVMAAKSGMSEISGLAGVSWVCIEAKRPDENGDNPEQGGSDSGTDPDADNPDNGEVRQ